MANVLGWVNSGGCRPSFRGLVESVGEEGDESVIRAFQVAVAPVWPRPVADHASNRITVSDHGLVLAVDDLPLIGRGEFGALLGEPGCLGAGLTRADLLEDADEVGTGVLVTELLHCSNRCAHELAFVAFSGKGNCFVILVNEALLSDSLDTSVGLQLVQEMVAEELEVFLGVLMVYPKLVGQVESAVVHVQDAGRLLELGFRRKTNPAFLA